MQRFDGYSKIVGRSKVGHVRRLVFVGSAPPDEFGDWVATYEAAEGTVRSKNKRGSVKFTQ